MRSWTLFLVCVAGSSCIVYEDDNKPTEWSTYSTPDDTTPVIEDGQIEIDWRIGSSGCEEGGVVAVEIALGASITTADCALESTTVTGPAGSYSLILRGLDDNGIPRYEGDGGQVQIRPEEITTAPTVVLSALPASLSATWYFDNGQLCSTNDVDVIDLSLFDDNDVLAANEIVPCGDGQIDLFDIEAGTYGMLMLGRNEGGAAIYGASLTIEAMRGDHVEVDVELTLED